MLVKCHKPRMLDFFNIIKVLPILNNYISALGEVNWSCNARWMNLHVCMTYVAKLIKKNNIQHVMSQNKERNDHPCSKRK